MIPPGESKRGQASAGPGCSRCRSRLQQVPVPGRRVPVPAAAAAGPGQASASPGCSRHSTRECRNDGTLRSCRCYEVWRDCGSRIRALALATPRPLSCSQLGARSPRHFTVGLDRVLLRFAAGDHARRNPMTLVASRVGPCQAHAAERKLVFTASRGRESSACVWEPGPYSSTSLKCSQHFAFLLSPMMHAFSCSGDLGGHLECCSIEEKLTRVHLGGGVLGV